MRFAGPALAFAGLAAAGAHETIYETKTYTQTNCDADVPKTDCPAQSTIITSSIASFSTSTVFATREHTITKCSEEVVDCPADQTVIETETVAVSTTLCEITATPAPEAPKDEDEGDYSEKPEEDDYSEKPEEGDYEQPEYPGEQEEETASSEVYHEPAPTYDAPIPGGEESSALEIPAPAPTYAPLPVPEEEECPVSHSVRTIATQVTTVVETTLYETFEVPCPTPSQPSHGIPAPPAVTPPGVAPPGNDTAPPSPSGAPPHEEVAAAPRFAGSVFVAAFAAVAAYAFA